MSAAFRRAAGLAAVMLILLPIAAPGFDLSAGLKGGVAMPFYSGPGYAAWLSDVDLTPNLAFRFGGGLFLTVGMADLLALQPEVFYSVLGGLSGSSVLWKDKVPALDGQLLLKLRFRLRGFKRLELFAGPQAILKLGAASFVVEDWSGYTTGTWNDFYLEDLTFGVVGGIGWVYLRGRTLFSVDVRYCHGLSSRFTAASGFGDWHQNVVQLMFGIGRQLAGGRMTPKPGRTR